MSEKQGKSPHNCQCAKCVASLSAATAQLHQQINQLAAMLNEKDRRQFVGLLARQLGRGGVTLMAEVTGLNRNTIMRGQRELVDREFSERVRRKGGGRSSVEKKVPDC
jgi:hypothetical protein